MFLFLPFSATHFRPRGNNHENHQIAAGKFVQFFCRKPHTNTEIYVNLFIRNFLLLRVCRGFRRIGSVVFSSLSFLFCFFPAFLLVYYLTPSRPAGARNAVLLAGSSVF